MNLPGNPLLEPFNLNGLPLRNRIVMAPLTRARAENPGHVTSLTFEPFAPFCGHPFQFLG
jgi:2,4-dienoyl-CoA reductase-like NADH-dependent reductase (Old Yellow Enzyme family)